MKKNAESRKPENRTRSEGDYLSVLTQPKRQTRHQIMFFVVSALCHVVFFGILGFAPDFSYQRNDLPPVINVDLVSFKMQPDSAAVHDRTKSVVQKKTAAAEKHIASSRRNRDTAESRVVQKPEKQKSDRLSSKTVTLPGASEARSPGKNKQSLKKKTLKAEKAVLYDPDTSRKTAAASKSTMAAKAAKSTKATTANEEPAEVTDDVFKRLQASVAGKDAERQSGRRGGEQGSAGRIAERLYLYEVAERVQQHWAFSKQLAAGHSNLETVLIFKIMPNGAIKDIMYEKRSGNRYLDESAYRAIVKANPVHPYPSGIRKRFLTVGLNFTPSGVQ